MRPWIEFIKEAMANNEPTELGTIRYLETYYPAFLRSATEIADRTIEDANRYLQIQSEDFPLSPVDLLIQVIATRV